MVLAMALVPGLPGASAALGPAATAPVAVELDGNLLSLEARDAALTDVLEAIAARAGFEILFMVPVTARVTSAMHRVPLPEAFRRLLGAMDYVVVHAPAGGQGTAPPVSALWVLGASAAAGASVAPPAHGARASPGEEVTGAAGEIVKARSEALLELAREGATQQVLDTLGEALERDEAALVRTRAAMALGALGDPRALPALQSALADPHRTVRSQALVAMSQIQDPAATSALGEVLLHGEDSRQRVLAAWGLWRQGTDAARALLADAANDADEQVRKAANGPPWPGNDDASAPASSLEGGPEVTR